MSFVAYERRCMRRSMVHGWLAAVLALPSCADPQITRDDVCAARQTHADLYFEDGGAWYPTDYAELEWAGPGEPAQLVTIEDDGGWCWFQDERAIHVGSRLLAGSVSRDGDVQVSSYDLVTGQTDRQVLAPRFQRDDHNAPALHRTRDGRIRAFYTMHNASTRIYARATTTRDGSIGEWTPEESIVVSERDDVCYANPLALDGESSAGTERLYLFHRGLNYGPAFLVSDDGGATWSEPTQFLLSRELRKGRPEIPLTHRPYVKYVTDGEQRIHFFYTDGHPGECNLGTSCLSNSVYHLYYENGALHRSDGQLVAELRPGIQVELAPSVGTQIHDGYCDGEAWVWDIELDDSGHPVVVYTAFAIPSPATYHSYFWARWDGARWQKRYIGHGGTGVYSGELFYSGGLALDPEDTNVVYYASNADPVVGVHERTGPFEIYRARATDEDARHWEITPITTASDVDNLRPMVPKHHGPETTVLWMRGTYNSYTDYDTSIVGLFGSADVIATPAGPNGSFAGQRTVQRARRADLHPASAAASRPQMSVPAAPSKPRNIGDGFSSRILSTPRTSPLRSMPVKRRPSTSAARRHTAARSSPIGYGSSDFSFWRKSIASVRIATLATISPSMT